MNILKRLKEAYQSAFERAQQVFTVFSEPGEANPPCCGCGHSEHSCRKTDKVFVEDYRGATSSAVGASSIARIRGDDQKAQTGGQSWDSCPRVSKKERKKNHLMSQKLVSFTSCHQIIPELGLSEEFVGIRPKKTNFIIHKTINSSSDIIFGSFMWQFFFLS